MCQFCDLLGLKYSYYVNSNRHHGFSLNPLDLKGYLVIAGDFAITENEMQALVDNDIVVLSTDHHEVQRTFIDVKSNTAEGIVINNQYPFEPEEDKYLSGAGVFYELICSLYPEFKSKERDAFVGITLLSDIRQIENAKARAYLRTTYTSDPTQGYIKYLIDSTIDVSYNFGQPKLDRNFIDYTLSPCINSLLRCERTNEAVDFILGKGLRSLSAKDYQKRITNAMSAYMNVAPDTHSCAIISFSASDFFEFPTGITNYIGLYCSDYKDKHGGMSTLGFVVENGKVTRASFRGKYDDIHYQSAFKNLGIKAEGHHNSFGIIDFVPTCELLVQIDDLIRELELDHTPTITVSNVSNLSVFMVQRGLSVATENCYVRDTFRHYIRYTGKNAKIVKQTFKTEEFTEEDYMSGREADSVVRGVKYKYVRGTDGNPLVKYIEYLVDGRTVKSFGERIETGLILPVLEKGYIQLYIRSEIK